MGFRTEVVPEDRVDSAADAARLVQENARLSAELCARLPSNRELLDKIYQYGLQPV
jgi:hypothetical protein